MAGPPPPPAFMSLFVGGGFAACGALMLWVRRRHGSHNLLADMLYGMWKSSVGGYSVDSYLLVVGIVMIVVGSAFFFGFIG